MKDIIETIQLENKNSTFLIDLVRHSSGRFYVEILQILQTNGKQTIRQHIKINPSLLPEIIVALQEFMKTVPKDQLVKKKKKEMKGFL